MKAERPNIKLIPQSGFQLVESVDELLFLLFGQFTVAGAGTADGHS